MTKNSKSSLLLACASTLIMASHGDASTITQWTSANAISPNSTVFSVPGTVGTVSSGPSLTFNNGDNQITFGRGSGNFEIDQAGVNYGNTSFANNTRLVGAGGFQGPGDGGSITISFKVPVTQFELNAEEFQSGNYTLTFNAFDTIGLHLGTFTNNGSQNALSFAGLAVSGEVIGSVSFTDLPSPAAQASGGIGTNNLLLGNLRYLNYNVAAQAPPPEVPEPATFAQFGIGLLTFAFVGRCLAARR